MKKITVIAVLLVLATSLFSQKAEDAEKVITQEVSRITNYLKTSSENLELKKKNVRAQVEPLFDFELITKLTIGKANWESLSPKKRLEFKQAYQNYLMEIYLDRLEQFTNQKISFGKSAMEGSSKATVPMDIKDGAAIYHMEYMLFFNKSWKIYDFEIEGVSIIRTYKSQFEPYFKEKRVDDLIKELNK